MDRLGYPFVQFFALLISNTKGYKNRLAITLHALHLLTRHSVFTALLPALLRNLFSTKALPSARLSNVGDANARLQTLRGAEKVKTVWFGWVSIFHFTFNLFFDSFFNRLHLCHYYYLDYPVGTHIICLPGRDLITSIYKQSVQKAISFLFTNNPCRLQLLPLQLIQPI